jgi:hypothetical protein
MTNLADLILLLFRNRRGPRTFWQATAKGFRSGGAGGAVVGYAKELAIDPVTGSPNEFGKTVDALLDDPLTPAETARGVRSEGSPNEN